MRVCGGIMFPDRGCFYHGPTPRMMMLNLSFQTINESDFLISSLLRNLSKPSFVLSDFSKFCFSYIPIDSISFTSDYKCLVNFLNPRIPQRSATTSANPQPSLTTASLETRFPFREARWRTLVVLPCHLARPTPRRRTCPGLLKSGNQKGVTVGWCPKLFSGHW